MNNIQPGIYHHYKGKEYDVIGTAQYTETKEEVVVYRALDDQRLYVRPKKEFLDLVVVDGKAVPRFVKKK
ncbi:DUF1653 domain-containing protein [Candidatus Woesearchaeota archaeon]|nr:DUF1653 domain-containing protein [Candidatus Woesearchaeota archaeon]